MVRKGEIEHKRAERRATLAVRKARRDYLAALASVETAKKQSDLGKEALLLTESAYNAGTGSSLDVTDARRTSLEADVSDISPVVPIARMTAVLEAAVGVLYTAILVGRLMGIHLAGAKRGS